MRVLVLYDDAEFYEYLIPDNLEKDLISWLEWSKKMTINKEKLEESE